MIIETSGLADPAPVMQTFFSHKTAQGRFALDGVVCMVDARHAWPHLEGEGWLARAPEVGRQIAHATTIVVNKVDTLPRDNPARSLAALEARLRSINPGAALLQAQHAQVCCRLHRPPPRPSRPAPPWTLHAAPSSAGNPHCTAPHRARSRAARRRVEGLRARWA